MTFRRALVRGVPSSYAQATVRGDRLLIDVAVARQQHAAYVAAVRASGVEVTVLPVKDDLPDSCFVEDQAVVAGAMGLQTRCGHEGRRAEAPSVALALAAWVPVRPMREGCLDGGDVLHVGRTLFVGRTDRTDATGVRALRDAFSDFDVVEVPVRDRLHLKSVCTALDDETVFAAEGTFDPSVFAGRAEVVRVPPDQEYGANVLALGRRIVVSSGYPKVAEAASARGYEPVLIDMSEFRKGDGALTCLSILVP